VEGRQAHISLQSKLPVDGEISITTIGKDAPTTAEQGRTEIVSGAFYTPSSLCGLPFFAAIWAHASPVWVATPKIPPTPLLAPGTEIPLNRSQETAVRAILAEDEAHRIVLVEGPPGTGKTTVIAAAVKSIDAAGSRRPVWLVAHSNVAVKNIAEKLARVGFLDFRLLVSKDFEFDWHEHLYTSINSNVIRSDTFPQTALEAERRLSGARVLLCTLSMLSNFKIGVFARVVPVETVIVDEASQIEVGDYVPLLHRYKATLAKLVFIGDDKQRASTMAYTPLVTLLTACISAPVQTRRDQIITQRIRDATPTDEGGLP
jgi:hypothetical protein